LLTIFGDVVDELDDQLGVAIARRRLAGEDFSRAGTQSRCGSSFIAWYSATVSRMLSSCRLVFVDALDLDVEQRSRIDLDVETLARSAAPVRPCCDA